MYAEWSCTEDDDPADPRSWAKANPGMGYRIRQDHIAAEYRALKHSPKTFSVERLGVGDWPALVADERQPVIPAETWDALAVAEIPPLVGSCALALDRTPDGKLWTLAAAWRTADAIHIEIGFHQQASNHEVLAKVLTCIAELDPCALVIDAKSSAASLRPYLAENGVEATISNRSEFILACGGLVDDIEAARITHSSQAVLGAAVASGGKRELPAGGWCWDKRSQEGTISPLVSSTLAHFGLLTYGPTIVKPKPTPIPLMDSRTRGDDDDHPVRDIMRIPF
jgi:hypothetical protein